MLKLSKPTVFVLLLIFIFGITNAQQDDLLPLPGRSAKVITSSPQDRDLVGMPYLSTTPTTDRRTRLIVELHPGFQASTLTAQLQRSALDVKVVDELNGGWMVIKALPEQLPQIQQMPSVKAVYPDSPVSADNSTSVPYIGTSAYWNTTVLTGKDIKIAIIDTGIDYRHKTFGGATSFPSTKVVSGFDYVDDDTDPLDCAANPHGTHVASTAAGFGVMNGETYNGPWNTTTNFAAMTVGPGVAPEAKLLAYRVLDCNGNGVTSDVISAIQQAIADGAKVINLALSTPYGGAAEVYEAAITAATNAGVIVVASAGDGGDTYFVAGQPGTSSRAISVGSGNENGNVSDFSARGSATNSILKPDLVAPGQDITSAFGMQADPAAAVNHSGTSMAAAHIAGAAALLRQQYPSWTYDQIKALMMNTAGDLQNSTSIRFGPGRVGAGRVNLNNLLNAEVIAYDSTNPALVSVSFGVVEVSGTQTATRQITVRNMTGNTLTYNVAFDTVVDMTGAAITVSPSTLNLAANGTAVVTVTLTTDLSAMVEPNRHDMTVSETQLNRARHWLSEESGYVELTRSNAPKTRVPVYAMPRPAASMTAQTPLYLGSGKTGVGELVFSGTEVDTAGSVPYGVMSQVTLFEHQLTSPSLTANPSADIQYVGITSDYLTQTSANTSTMYFGLSTYGSWTSPETVRFVIEIDTNNDGIVDGELFNSNHGTATTNAPTDSFISVYRSIASNTAVIAGRLNELSPASLDTRLFNTNVLVFPVDLSMLGFIGNDLDLQYRVKSYIGGVLIDQVPSSGFSSYNIAAPLYTFNDLTNEAGGPYPKMPIWGALNGVPTPIDYNLTSLTGAVPDILALHHHNSVNRAEVIDVQYIGETDLQLTKTVDNAEPNEGGQVTFTLQLHNSGTASAPDVQVSEVIPSGLTFVNANPSAGSYANGVWNLTGYSLLPGASATLGITATVNSGTLHDQIINQVSIISTHAATIDTNLSNNSATAFVCVGGFAGCEIPPLSPFTLNSPANNTTFTSGAQITNFTWAEAQNALTYALTLNRTTPAAQILNVSNLTATADTDALICANGICTLTLSPATQASLTEGTYQWTVTVTNGIDLLTASNAPFTLMISSVIPTPTSTPIPVELLRNGGFETRNGKMPAEWNGKGMTKDKMLCNKPEENKFFAYKDLCAFQFKGVPGENSKLKQNINLTSISLDAGDTLTLSVFAQAKSLPKDKLSIIVKLVYTDDTKDSIILKPDAKTYAYKGFSSTPKLLSKGIRTMKAIIKFRGTSGKVLLDEVSLSFPQN